MSEENTCFGCKNENERPNVSLREEEISLVRKRLGREPNAVEWAMIDVMWSEHCSYKSSRKYLKLFPTEGKNVLLGVGDDCGIIKFDEKYGIAIGMESHNHPSAIEPVAGAATGVGGIVRDIFSKGAKPIACLDPLRLGDIKNHERSKYLFENIVKGIADYGNCIGVPTIGGEAEFDSSFNGNPLVNVVCIGLVENDKIVRSVAEEGDTMMLIGSKTGRDGIHGVTFASEELESGSEETSRPAVQIEDPLSEKLLIDAFMEIYCDKWDAFTGCKDLGGGGFSCATSEIVHKGGRGAIIELEKVHLREEGMEPWEILLSETQERMMLIVKRGREEEIEGVLDKWDIPHSRVGVVTGDGQYKIRYRGEIIVDMPTHILTEGPLFDRPYEPIIKKRVEKPQIKDMKEYFITLLKNPNIASKKWISEQYDSKVQVRTVIDSGENASVTRISEKEGVVLGTGCNSSHCAIDIKEGSKGALCEALRNISCMGAEPLCAVDCLNFGNPEKPKAFWQFKTAVENLAEGLKHFGIPVISGNVSFYNETSGKSINPSPIVTVLGKVPLDLVMTMGLKKEGETIVIIGKTHDELGDAPKVDFELEKNTNELIVGLIRERKVSAVHDVSKGGLAVGLAKMAFSGGRGFDISLARMDEEIPDEEKLFSESSARFIVTTSDPERVVEEAKRAGIKAQVIGRVGGDRLAYGAFDISLSKAKKAWDGGLSEHLV